ncbi:MAG: bifunctional oligoribonuclease/PAP phosphatase NrnA [Ignavibacteria bacterium]
MIDFSTLDKIVRENNSFLLTTHVNPDADAIGSEIAFYMLLKKLGKTVYIINHSGTPYNLAFLDKDNIIEIYENEKHDKLFNEVDVLVALDFNNLKRTVGMETVFSECRKLKVCIDHHQNPAEFADNYYFDVNYAATGHVIFDFIKKTAVVELCLNIAVPIYAAIMTDTGSFRFHSTTSEIHRICAELIDIGVNPNDVYNRIFDESRYSKIRLLGESLSTIRMNSTGEIAYIIITREILGMSGAEEAEVDGFVNFCLSIKGVKIGILFFELTDGIKVSFRSKGTIPVNKLAAEFGGGGHINASGTRLFNASLQDYAGLIIKTAEKYL